MRRVRTLAIHLILGTTLALLACGGGDVETGRADGVVVGVDLEQTQITIDHGDIPGLMKAMTMTFDVSDPSLLEGIAAGDEISFVLRHAEGSYAVVEIDRR